MAEGNCLVPLCLVCDVPTEGAKQLGAMGQTRHNLGSYENISQIGCVFYQFLTTFRHTINVPGRVTRFRTVLAGWGWVSVGDARIAWAAAPRAMLSQSESDQ